MILSLFNKLYNKIYSSVGTVPEDKRSIQRKSWYSYTKTRSILGIREGMSIDDTNAIDVWDSVILDYFLWLDDELFNWMKQNNTLLITKRRTRTAPLDLISMLNDSFLIFHWYKDVLNKDIENSSRTKIIDNINLTIISEFTKYIITNGITRLAIDLDISKKTRDVSKLIDLLMKNNWKIIGANSISIGKSKRYTIVLNHT